MSLLSVDYSKCNLCKQCLDACPFAAIEISAGQLQFTEACKVCKICIKRCPNQAISLSDIQKASVNKDDYRGVLVFAEQVEGEIHPVTFELIGKGLELAAKVGQEVNAVLVGHNFISQPETILRYGVQNVYVYDQPELAHYRVEPYAAALEDCIKRYKPAIVLVGATSIGRSLGPRISTRFRTGLTADCTILDIKENTDLVQIRPAFGGNIMAQIVTPRHRPQMATVRYKVMNPPQEIANPVGQIVPLRVSEDQLQSRIKVLEITKKPVLESIVDADVIIAGGRGLREEKDLRMLYELADLLGGKVAVTRPLIENGWGKYHQQIGLSGRSVRPKLIITVGISGSVQFVAGMKNSDYIFAINNDPKASIFNVAHYGIVGDLYQIVPQLIERIKEGGTIDAL